MEILGQIVGLLKISLINYIVFFRADINGMEVKEVLEILFQIPCSNSGISRSSTPVLGWLVSDVPPISLPTLEGIYRFRKFSRYEKANTVTVIVRHRHLPLVPLNRFRLSDDVVVQENFVLSFFIQTDMEVFHIVLWVHPFRLIHPDTGAISSWWIISNIRFIQNQILSL
ncbi:hypothetical protein WUBG_00005 [Wuchereria bancrofti]|uniref:Uncharacterized protein n=1 Tax=Wuchereria bancrofti TaxID=6293 RepID=J9F3K2_WUCBA|nr:hypothetical protein WUBG_00005 [Wuchereria bancrofti]